MPGVGPGDCVHGAGGRSLAAPHAFPPFPPCLRPASPPHTQDALQTIWTGGGLQLHGGCSPLRGHILEPVRLCSLCHTVPRRSERAPGAQEAYVALSLCLCFDKLLHWGLQKDPSCHGQQEDVTIRRITAHGLQPPRTFLVLSPSCCRRSSETTSH